jgi:hypothetical protein
LSLTQARSFQEKNMKDKNLDNKILLIKKR